jgi:serine/threonine-protein kinase
MRCTACQRDIPEASRFCPSCGSPIGSSDALTFTVATHHRPVSADAIDQARFIPGAMLADRYRIVSLIGRGGMGEVYRAEDLKLGQPVALKFLPKEMARDADRLARFHNEVRVARQVSHPNVCRVYDIGEAAGQHFLSMEYVDGEDLASLLRRIGRLPPDKAIDVARQLCAGLAAAHDRGVLHRDLKPANVLIDGRGRVRIADFGLAGLADERRDPDVVAGTPAYMAPEQFAGRAASMRTDVYALGLVLYEMFTGKPAFKVAGADLMAQVADQVAPTSPAALIPDFDPAVERVILQCLDRDPARRPPSALAVAAALPGGDPLAAALAAGETPSPDAVAVAGEVGSLSPGLAVACLAVIALGIVPIVWMSPRTTLVGFVTMDKGPEVLAERARTIARNLGYTDRPADSAYGYETDLEYLRHIDDHDRSATRWDVLRAPQPPALSFWYRQSPRQLISVTSKLESIGEVSRLNPAPNESGMLSVLMDPAGRLTGLTAVAPQMDEPATDTRRPDWTALFAEAGLPIAAFSPARPAWIPPLFADARAAWEGVYPDRPEIRIRVEAAAARGRPVYFEIVAPWTRLQRLEPTRFPTAADRARYAFGASLGLLFSVGAVLLARRNLRMGRGDRRGAFRLSLYFGTAALLFGMLRAHHLADLAAERDLFLMQVAFAAYVALAFWIFYIALEPYARRVWPETMIGWSRLLAGRFRDPLVGRDILVGVLTGIVLTIVVQLDRAAPAWFGVATPPPASTSTYLLLGGRHALGALVGLQARAVAIGVVFLLALMFFNVLLRSRRIAAAAMMLVMTVTPGPHPLLAAGNPIFDLVFRGFWAAVVVFLFVRFGLLATIVSVFVDFLTTVAPITFDPSVPYVASSYLILGTVFVLGAYGFHTALADRPVFGRGFLPDEQARP